MLARSTFTRMSSGKNVTKSRYMAWCVRSRSTASGVSSAVGPCGESAPRTTTAGVFQYDMRYRCSAAPDGTARISAVWRTRSRNSRLPVHRRASGPSACTNAPRCTHGSSRARLAPRRSTGGIQPIALQMAGPTRWKG